MTENLDLFGVPIPAGHGKRGRPVHVATQENRNKVNMLLAFGWSNERIAMAIGISLPTFRKVYFHELRQRVFARDRLDATRLMKLWELGINEGNVTALRELDRVIIRNDAMVAEKLFRDDDDEHQPAKLGKKQAAAIAAETAGQGSDWGNDLDFKRNIN